MAVGDGAPVVKAYTLSATLAKGLWPRCGALVSDQTHALVVSLGLCVGLPHAAAHNQSTYHCSFTSVQMRRLYEQNINQVV